MAQKHDVSYIENPMTVGTHTQGPQKRYRRLRFPSFHSAVWAEKNPLLQKGELGHEKDTGRFKVGDGVTYWLDLPYNSVGDKGEKGDDATINGIKTAYIVGGTNIEITESGNTITISALGEASGTYTKEEIDNKVTVINAAIDANSTAIQKTREDYMDADTDIMTIVNAQATAITGKQDKLIAGDNIVISGNVISATGAGGGAGFDVIIVQELPAEGEKGIIYLLAKDSEAPDIYDEYVWITSTQTFELIGTTQIDLTGYVKNTDYATTSIGGVIKISNYYGSKIFGDGKIAATTTDLAGYKSAPNDYFIGKGTVENIKEDLVKRAITENNIELTDSEKQSAQAWLGIESCDCGLIIRRL